MLLEPIMNVEVVTDENNSSLVLSDFGRRRATIQNITTRSNNLVSKSISRHLLLLILLNWFVR